MHRILFNFFSHVRIYGCVCVHDVKHELYLNYKTTFKRILCSMPYGIYQPKDLMRCFHSFIHLFKLNLQYSNAKVISLKGMHILCYSTSSIHFISASVSLSSNIINSGVLTTVKLENLLTFCEKYTMKVKCFYRITKTSVS